MRRGLEKSCNFLGVTGILVAQDRYTWETTDCFFGQYNQGIDGKMVKSVSKKGEG